MDKADLHIHTIASDGLLSPSEVIDWAIKRHLKSIAITDHDTVKGIREALQKGQEHNIKVIPGIELSSDYKGMEVHILGYFIDYNNTNLSDTTRKLRNSRLIRGKLIVEKLKQLEIDISIEDVNKISDSEFIGRPHIARVLIDKGYASNIQEAFDKYLSKGKPGYVERFKLSIKESIDMIHKAKGVAVLAHPGLLGNSDVLSYVIDNGIDGIEINHSKHSSQDIKKYKLIANSYGLIETGGSDCHGVLYDRKPILGNFFTDYKNVIRLERLAREKYQGGIYE